MQGPNDTHVHLVFQGLVWFFILFWTRLGPVQSSEISFLGKNRTRLGKTGLHQFGLRYLSTLNQLRPRPVSIPSKCTQKHKKQLRFDQVIKDLLNFLNIYYILRKYFHKYSI